MAKVPSPWYRKEKDGWYVQWHGKQVLLAKGKDQIAEAYRKLADLLDPRENHPRRHPPTVKSLVSQYKDYLTPRIKQDTYAVYSVFLHSFSQSFDGKTITEVTAQQVEDWARKPNWNETTQNYALSVIQTMFRWTDRPLKRLRKPTPKRRADNCLILADKHTLLLATVSEPLRDFLEALKESGARPGEIASVEARHVNWPALCVKLSDHKTARQGRDRIIYLNEKLLQLFERLARLHPTGPLFLNNRGRRWSKGAWHKALVRAQAKLRLKKRPIAYGYRHSWATTALANGVPETHVAALLGHADTKMLHHHYSHLTSKANDLRKSLGQIE